MRDEADGRRVQGEDQASRGRSAGRAAPRACLAGARRPRTLAAKPTAKTAMRATAIGWMKPSEIAPPRRRCCRRRPPREVLELPRDEPRVDDVLELGAVRRVDDRHEEAPRGEGQRDHQQLDPLRPPGVPEQRPVHRCGPADRSASDRADEPVRCPARLRVELQERLLQVGRLDRQVDDRGPGEGRQERRHVTLEVARQQAVAERHVADAGDTVEPRDRAPDADLDVSPATGEQGRHVLQGHEPTLADDRHPVAHPLDLGQDVRARGRPSGPPRAGRRGCRRRPAA